MTAELEEYLSFFEEYWGQVHKLLADLPPAALNWRPLEGGDEHATNSLAATLTHVAGAQRYWVGDVAGGRPGQRDRAAEFKAQAGDAAELLGRLEAADEVARQVLNGLTSEQLDQTVESRGRTVSRRWAVLHALEHLALHTGHMQLTRLLWEASSGQLR
jgi:uncharacterized damage-inducible protein DinB